MSTSRPDMVRLLHGPYSPPPLKRGDRATCLYRDADVIITGWSDARIAWPRCRRPGTRGGGSGLLVNDELLRAIRTESSIAIQFWWGVRGETVARWKRFFGIGQWEPEGSRRLHRQTSRAGANAVKQKTFTQAERMRYRAAAKKRGTQPNRWKDTGWTSEQIALLGRVPDNEAAVRIGRTTNAVRLMRTKRGIPSACDRRMRGNKTE
jgi:hypothetical protein